MELTSIAPRRGAVHTPLRYPGGKTRLTAFLERVITAGGWRSHTYAEPFAGGAGAAISLLMQGVVERIAINDLDPAIFAFWKSITDDGDAFLDLFDRTEVTLDEWKRQRDIYREPHLAERTALGFATFFLNRTNRSGVLRGGVIGGLKQQGADLIDARYNRVELRARIKALVEAAGRIEVTNLDGAEFIDRRSDESFIYADPPYVNKGSSLYLNHFREDDHRALASRLTASNADRVWLVTYDDVPLVREMYKGSFQGTFELPYSAHTAGAGYERLIASESVAKILRSFENL